VAMRKPINMLRVVALLLVDGFTVTQAGSLSYVSFMLTSSSRRFLATARGGALVAAAAVPVPRAAAAAAGA